MENDRNAKIKSESIVFWASIANICPLIIIEFVIMIGADDVFSVPLANVLFLYQGLAVWIVFIVIFLWSLIIIIENREKKGKDRKKVYVAMLLSAIPVVVNLYILFTNGMSV